MHRIDHATAAPGNQFTEGNPATATPATKVTDDWLNDVQENVCAVIEAAGIALVKGTTTQLRDAIQSMITGAQKAVVINGVTFEASVTDGKVVRWDSGNSRFDEAVADGTGNDLAVAVADVTNSKVYLFGECPLFSGLTLGARYYLDPTTPGALTTIAPSDAVMIGIAKSATTLWVDVDSAAGPSIPTGATFDYVGSAAPSGYVLLSGRTIGSASSGATERANADTSALFTLLWNSMANTEAAVSGGRGASAAADFSANKTITLPDARGRTVAGKDNMGGTTASRLTGAGSGITGTTLGTAGGTETHTLTIAQLAAHTHTGTPDQNAAAPGAGGGFTNVGGTSGSTGSNNAHQNTQPTLVLNKIIKL